MNDRRKFIDTIKQKLEDLDNNFYEYDTHDVEAKLLHISDSKYRTGPIG